MKLRILIFSILAALVSVMAPAQTQSELDYQKLGDLSRYQFNPGGHSEIDAALNRAYNKARIQAAQERISKAKQKKRVANGKQGGAPVGGAPRTKHGYSHGGHSGGSSSDADHERRKQAVAEAGARTAELAAQGMSLVGQNSRDAAAFNQTKPLSADEAIMNQRGFRGNYVEGDDEQTTTNQIHRDPLQGLIGEPKEPKERSIEEILQIFVEDENKLDEKEMARLAQYLEEEAAKLEFEDS